MDRVRGGATGKALAHALAGAGGFGRPRSAATGARGRIGGGSPDEAGSAEAGRPRRALTIHSHLKMEGSWQVYAPGGRWRKPGHTARCVLRTATADVVGFSLGILEVIPTPDESRVVGHLGPDLLGPGWDAEEAVRRLRAAPDTPIGVALLDQRNLAGIGNIYRCEACFLAGVHPAAPVSAVPDLATMLDGGQGPARGQPRTRAKDHAWHRVPWSPGDSPLRLLGVRPRAPAVPSLRYAHSPRAAGTGVGVGRPDHLLLPEVPARSLTLPIRVATREFAAATPEFLDPGVTNEICATPGRIRVTERPAPLPGRPWEPSPEP